MNQAIHISKSIHTLTRLYNATLENFMKELNLTKPQGIIIGQIYKEPKTIGQITEAVQLSYSTVSGIIDRLERDEWIQRVRDKTDRRVIWIQRTDKMDEIRNKVEFYHEQFFHTVLSDLEADELDKISTSLDLLNSQLEKKGSYKF
ncbi:DNA-binding transcriptional regulator, MarR family [Paenibacillus sp. 1_12]|uniref:MarR family winged helix-turn-helix transcriptional regulator n=1 Tax=Paenibacillus sp. 1_12 TaxID=1566278 RepID=UPI0008EA5C11|nr:MarR family transcriptional regulator [Paenibacillus sp. 1_12]SFK74806.1 DNA-binding transcriptional regulator, MarR family [Paenibacillus sp. 1_12]